MTAARARLLALGVVLSGLLTHGDAPACGPSYAECRFDDPWIPDVAPERVLQGEFGVIRPGLPWPELLRIYRHLQGFAPGGKTSPEETGDITPEPSWEEVRARLPAIGPAPKISWSYESASYVRISRVNDHALGTAARTLEKLLETHGPDDPSLRDWVLAQDGVFASEAAKPRIPPEVSAPAWLVPERNYQIAAARFYASQWAEARKDFLRIAGDESSPWQPWGRYLAARCWIREAELTDPELPFDRKRSLYREAEALLKAGVRNSASTAMHAPTENLLELVRYRTEPDALLAEVLLDQEREHPRWPESAALTKIRDALGFLEDEKRQTALLKASAPPADDLIARSDLGLWFGALARRVPWDTTAETALRRWSELGTPAWLVAALATARPGTPGLDPLKSATREALQDPRLGPTIRWHLVRLELAELEGDALTSMLDRALDEGRDLPPWAVNELRGQRQRQARDAPAWVGMASRRIAALTDDESPGPFLPDQEMANLPAETFDTPTARALSRDLPLARVPSLLEGSGIPSLAREEIAKAAWTKAVLLEAWDDARALTPFLHPRLKEAAAGALRGSDSVELRFQALLLLLDWPGLRPQVEAGYGRQHAGGWRTESPSPLAEFDTLRDNWWCSLRDEGARPGSGAASPGAPRIPGLSPEETAAADEEWKRMLRVPAAQTLFGTVALAYAETHAADPRVPRALHRFVLSTRSPLCPDTEMSVLGKKAFRLLHKRYPKSEWAERTPYYY